LAWVAACLHTDFAEVFCPPEAGLEKPRFKFLRFLGFFRFLFLGFLGL